MLLAENISKVNVASYETFEKGKYDDRKVNHKRNKTDDSTVVGKSVVNLSTCQLLHL